MNLTEAQRDSLLNLVDAIIDWKAVKYFGYKAFEGPFEPQKLLPADCGPTNDNATTP